MKNIKLFELYNNIQYTLHEHSTNYREDSSVKSLITQFSEGDISDILNHYAPILRAHNCQLKVTSAPLKKQGHIQYKVSRSTNEVEHIEMKLVRQNDFISMVYVFFHELTHLVNEHPLDKSITSKQKEIVADTVAKILIEIFFELSSLYDTELSEKLALPTYSINWMQNATLSEPREKIVFEQIDNALKKVLT